MKVGIVREGKINLDTRVPLIPKQCRYLLDKDGDLQILPTEVDMATPPFFHMGLKYFLYIYILMRNNAPIY